MKQVEFPSQARPSWVAPLNPAIAAVTARVVARSQAMRAAYLAQVGPAVEALRRGPAREVTGEEPFVTVQVPGTGGRLSRDERRDGVDEQER